MIGIDRGLAFGDDPLEELVRRRVRIGGGFGELPSDRRQDGLDVGPEKDTVLEGVEAGDAVAEQGHPPCLPDELGRHLSHLYGDLGSLLGLRRRLTEAQERTAEGDRAEGEPGPAE